MSTGMYATSLSFLFGTILIVFGMKYFSAAFQARTRGAADGAYRALAERSAAAQAETQATLAALKAELARVSAGIAAVEKILKQVE